MLRLKGRKVEPRKLARGLGWFSIALGAAEIIAPRLLARQLGMKGQQDLVRVYGFREIISGYGILRSSNPALWVWSRVIGDALDMATLGVGYRKNNGLLQDKKRRNISIAFAAVGGVALLDAVCAGMLTAKNKKQKRMIRMYDYSSRSGFPKSPDKMRGAAKDANIPRDMRAPEAMRPYNVRQETDKQTTVRH
jgi:hypothetical protein